MTAAESSRLTNLPESISELIGRDNELREILKLSAAHRLLTLTGAGGIGKTRLALSAARELLPQFSEGAWLAEFSSLAGPGLVASTVAAAVGLEIGGGEISTQRVAHAIAGRRMLLMLDTCEHVIAAAAAMVDAVQRAGSAVHIIATSREPLRVEGEWIYPVLPLPVPTAAARDSSARLLSALSGSTRLRSAHPVRPPKVNSQKRKRKNLTALKVTPLCSVIMPTRALGNEPFWKKKVRFPR